MANLREIFTYRKCATMAEQPQWVKTTHTVLMLLGVWLIFGLTAAAAAQWAWQALMAYYATR